MTTLQPVGLLVQVYTRTKFGERKYDETFMWPQELGPPKPIPR